jgi:hypothetical protein
MLAWSNLNQRKQFRFFEDKGDAEEKPEEVRRGSGGGRHKRDGIEELNV